MFNSQYFKLPLKSVDERKLKRVKEVLDWVQGLDHEQQELIFDNIIYQFFYDMQLLQKGYTKVFDVYHHPKEGYLLQYRQDKLTESEAHHHAVEFSRRIIDKALKAI